MLFISIFSLFCLGAILGSFLNVVVLRLGTGVSYLSGRSRCQSCGHILSPLELVPVFSYILERGRCLTCASRISPQYILVEVVMGFFVLGSFYLAGIFESFSYGALLKGFFYSALCFTGLGIAVYDMRHKIIPDGLLYAFLTLSFGAAVYGHIFTGFSIPGLFYALSAGPLLFIPFFLIWYFSNGRLMGLGDGLLSIGTGWLLGPSLSVSAVIFGVWFGAIWSITLLLIGKVYAVLGLNSSPPTLTMKSEVPLAPFLLLGLLVVAVSGINLLYVPLPNF